MPRGRHIPFRFIPIPCSFQEEWLTDRRIRRSEIAIYQTVAYLQFGYRKPRAVTQAQLALLAGMSREQAQRSLNTLHDLGLIESSGPAKRPRLYRLKPVHNLPVLQFPVASQL